VVRLKILNSYYKVIDEYSISESSREVKFSNIKIDFTDKTIADLPKKYQEIQLVDVDSNYNINEIIYTGYVNNFILPNMKNEHEYRELEIDLLSPLAMATVRTVDAVGIYKLQPLVRSLIQPLISDGFVLKEMNIGNNQITVNYLNETVESSLNKLSNKFNFWWYIDKNKNIYINSIEYLIAKMPKLVYDDNNKINGLIDVIPSIDATDYCNVVDFTNLRLYTLSRFQRNEYVEDGMTYYRYLIYNSITQITEIKKGDEITFDIPFDITIENYLEAINKTRGTYDIFFGSFSNSNNQEITSKIYLQDNQLTLSNNVAIEDSFGDSKDFVFVRDSFFKNLIIGFKYNGNDNLKVKVFETPTGLMWSKVKVINNEEVNKNKGIISQTGIVEKQINMNGQWKFYDEIIDIANSYIKKNASRVEQVKLNIDEDIDINIGDTIKINKEFFLINDTYIVTDKNINFESNYKTIGLTLKNTNILENYVDLFRSSEEEAEDKEYYLITANYEEETIKESYEVVEL
jgi:hypothetical protein